MPFPWDVRVRVYYPEIAGMFQPGGEVNREATHITVEVEAEAVVRAALFSPSPQPAATKYRDARIIDSHNRTVVPTGLYGTFGYVSNDSPHAKYKHQGTSEIVAPRGRPMRLRPGYGWPARRAYAVQGQEGTPWLYEAARDVLLRYGVLLKPEDFESAF